jgi:hypothetical protein
MIKVGYSGHPFFWTTHPSQKKYVPKSYDQICQNRPKQLVEELERIYIILSFILYNFLGGRYKI